VIDVSFCSSACATKYLTMLFAGVNRDETENFGVETEIINL
jgi:hypothetical protein